LAVQEVNPKKGLSLARLRRAIRASQEQLAPFRQEANRLLEEIAGPRYGANYAGKQACPSQPFNILAFAARTYARQIAARNPRVKVYATDKQYRPVANSLELAVNQRLRILELAESVRACAFDALIGVGITKTYMRKRRGRSVLAVDSVSLADWVHDPAATRWGMDSVGFCGDRYRVSLEELRSNPRAKQDVVKRLRPSRGQVMDNTSPRPQELTVRTDEEGINDDVEVWDIFLPRLRLILCLPDQDLEAPLMVLPYDGHPEQGPYHLLRFFPLSDNIMPVCPLSPLLELHTAVNELLQKTIRQSRRQRDLLVCEQGSATDAERIVNSVDADVLPLQNPGGVGEKRIGGPDQATLFTLLQCMQLFNKLGGNIDVLAGLGSGAPTLGQDQLMATSASQMVADMAESVSRLARHVVEDIAYDIFTDRTLKEMASQTFGPLKIDDLRITNESFRGEFFQYAFDVEPYSMQHQTPAQQFAALMTVFNNFVAPYAQVLQAQGGAIDFRALLKRLADLTGLRDLDEIVRFAELPTDTMQQNAGPAPRPGISPAGNNGNAPQAPASGGGTAGMNDVMSRLLAGGNVQDGERRRLIPSGVG